MGISEDKQWNQNQKGQQKQSLNVAEISQNGSPADWQPAKKATGAFMAGWLFVIDRTVKKATMKIYIILPDFISKSMP